MGKLAGCALILSGITLAGLTLPFADQLDARTMPTPEAVATAAPAAAPAPGPARPVASNNAGRVASFAPASARDIALPEAAPRKPLGAFHTATVPNDPVHLARALQQELRRAGCYDGEINGVWSPASRKAMKSLTDRVNASLPVDRPDFILLSLAQAQSDKVCRQQCPPGQALGDKGRCLPQSVLAHARKGPVPARLAHVSPPATPGAVARTDGQITLNAGQPIIAPPAPTAQAPVPASPQFRAETPRMALAGPAIPNAVDLKPEPGTPPQATPPLAHHQPDKAPHKAREHKAHREREKERRLAREKPPAFGQTRWAREFFKRLDGSI